jgi:hypothetical protein
MFTNVTLAYVVNIHIVSIFCYLFRYFKELFTGFYKFVQDGNCRQTLFFQLSCKNSWNELV